MNEQLERTARLLGEAAMERLRGARVAVFGIGGVGGYAAEALARTGIGALDLIDHDTVSLTNLNRQIIATHSTLGQYKVDAMRDRILDIAPDTVVRTHRCFFLPETRADFDFSLYSYVVDAVDTVSAKVELVLAAQAAGTPIISSMGAGNKLDGSRFRVADIYETEVCPLAKVMRKAMRAHGIESLKVVYSDEPPRAPQGAGAAAPDGAAAGGRRPPGSVAFVPGVAGLLLAGEVVRDLIADIPVA